MKTSELITALQVMREQYGDLDVLATTDDGRGPIHILRAQFEPIFMSDASVPDPMILLISKDTVGWEPEEWEITDEKSLDVYLAEWNTNEFVTISFCYRYDYTRMTFFWRSTATLENPDSAPVIKRRISGWQPEPELSKSESDSKSNGEPEKEADPR